MLPKLPRLRAKAHRDGSRSYWYDHGGQPRRWEPLGKVENVAQRRYDELERAGKAPPGTVDTVVTLPPPAAPATPPAP